MGIFVCVSLSGAMAFLMLLEPTVSILDLSELEELPLTQPKPEVVFSIQRILDILSIIPPK